MKQSDLLGLVRTLHSTEDQNPGVPVERLYEEATARFDADEETVGEALQYLLRRGEVYQPTEETVKPTTDA